MTPLSEARWNRFDISIRSADEGRAVCVCVFAGFTVGKKDIHLRIHKETGPAGNEAELMESAFDAIRPERMNDLRERAFQSYIKLLGIDDPRTSPTPIAA